MSTSSIPHSAEYELSPKLFLEELTSYLEELATYPGNIIIAGDFNLHMDVPDDPIACGFTDVIGYIRLTQNVSESTHKAGQPLNLLIKHGYLSLIDDVTSYNPVYLNSAYRNFHTFQQIP